MSMIWPIFYGKLLYKKGQDFLDLQYISIKNHEEKLTENAILFNMKMSGFLMKGRNLGQVVL